MKGDYMSRKATVNTEPVKDESMIATENVADEKPIVPKEVDPNTYVTVLNGFQGRLIYISPKTGEKFVWDSFGDEQEIELRELRNARSSAKTFYEKNWFMFDKDNQWVIDYLGVGRFYKNAIPVDGFDDIFKLPPDKIKGRISKISEGQKQSVIYRAKQLIGSGDIDSLKVIAALEDALGTELIEKG